jgi:hypothetical protein
MLGRTCRLSVVPLPATLYPSGESSFSLESRLSEFLRHTGARRFILSGLGLPAGNHADPGLP